MRVRIHGCFHSRALSTFLQVLHGLSPEHWMARVSVADGRDSWGLTGFFSIRQRMQAPRFLTSCTSFLLDAVNLPLTLGLMDLDELPNSEVNCLWGVWGFIAIARGYVAARAGLVPVVTGLSRAPLKKLCSPWMV